jgi:hypothetical protein
MAEIEQILEERGNNYGEFSNHAALSQTLKNTIMQHYFIVHGGDQATPLPAFMVEAISMIAHKLARIANGNPFYDDSWKDISGYAELAVKGIAQLEAAKASKAKETVAPVAVPVQP